MNTPKRKRKMVPMYSAEDFLSGRRHKDKWNLNRDSSSTRRLATFGAMVESNTYYTLRTPYGIAMARDDMAVLEQLGCSPEAKNIFGISPAMMMRWTDEMMRPEGE